MRGFQPRSAAGAKEQRFADGGFVQGIKRAFGMDEERNAQIAAYRARAAAEKAQQQAQAQQSAQTAAPAVSDYAGMNAMKRREKELGLADGGRVRPRGFVAGKGTATSDSIPARLSNGEYVLPADTVRAVGVEALDALRESTHKPVKGEQANAARGFFAGGTPGGVGTWFQDQEREQEQRKQEALAAGRAAESEAQAAAAPTTDNTSAAQAGAYAPGTRGAQLVAAEQQKAQPTTATAAQPTTATAAQPTTATAAQPTTATEQPRWQQNLEELVNPTQYQGQIGNALLKPSGTRDQLANIVPGVQGAGGGRGFVNPSSVTPSATATTTAEDSIAGAGRGSVNQPLANPSAPAPSAQPAATTAREVVPGVFNHGRGQYSDDPTGMNMPKGFTGQPSAANNAILERMSDQSKAESMARLGFGPQAQYAAEVQRAKNINADEAARNNSVAARMQRLADPFTAEGRAMRNLNMDIASSLDREGRPTAATAALLAQSKAMSDGYLAEPKQQRTIEAGLEREGMQQAGATARTGMQEQGANTRDAGRTALARDEFGLKKEAAGFQTRAAKRLEDLQNSYQSAKTPEERAAIAQQLRELQGKEQPARYKVASGGQQIDANGVAYRTPDRIYNEQTGVYSDGAGAAPAPQALPPKDQLKAGQTYSTPRGPARWDGSQFTPV